MQMGVAKGLKVPCLFMITEVSIRCPKNPEVGVQRIPAYTPPPNIPLVTRRHRYRAVENLSTQKVFLCTP